MSKTPDTEKPNVENPRSYPWGDNTGTYKLWIVLISINIIFLSVAFLINTEIPFLQETLNPVAIEKGQSGSLAIGNSTDALRSGSPGEIIPVGDSGFVDLLGKYGMWVIAANIALVWITKVVGKWVTSLEKWCKNMCSCKWYKPWCCLGKLFCWFVTVVKWVLYTISILSAVITSVLVWVSANSNIQG